MIYLNCFDKLHFHSCSTDNTGSTYLSNQNEKKKNNSIIKCEYLKITVELLIAYFMAHTWPITRLHYCNCKYKMVGEDFLFA